MVHSLRLFVILYSYLFQTKYMVQKTEMQFDDSITITAIAAEKT